MRKFAILAWLLLPILAGAYHFGPGQQKVQLDNAASHLAAARSAAHSEDWNTAVKSYEAALALIPTDRTLDSQRIQVELAKARMLNHQLPTAHKELLTLVENLTTEPRCTDQALVNDARSALANSQFYITWLMRLEGAPREEWEKHIDASRQNYKLIAEAQTMANNSDAIATAQHDLEAAIRLSRMDLAELQGLPLPSQ